MTRPIDDLLADVAKDVAARKDPYLALVRGVDEPWDVSLVRLFWEVVGRSAKKNIREMAEKHLFEQGTEATAVTVVEMYDNALPDEMEDFRIDRPFYFTIESQDAILFVGRVNELQSTAGVGTAKVAPHRDGIYDLQGRRLSQRPDRGVFVEDGKMRVAK